MISRGSIAMSLLGEVNRLGLELGQEVSWLGGLGFTIWEFPKIGGGAGV